MSDKIEGIPDGWELDGIRQAEPSEPILDDGGNVAFFGGKTKSRRVFPILKKIEKHKQYRPFESAAEFEPNKDRWILNATIDDPGAVGMAKITAFDDEGVTLHSNIHFTYGDLFELDIRFDNYQPFGVEVQDE